MILIVSGDEDAARPLCSALERAGRPARWESDLDRVRAITAADPPLVLVADAAVRGVTPFLAELQGSVPWTRVFLMAVPAAAPSTSTPVFFKPFDAAEVASLLGRELELAELDRLRRGLEARADELALLVEASFEAIVGLAPDGTIRSWNPGATAIYGYRPEEVVGRSVGFLESEPNALRARLEKSDRTASEVHRRRKNGLEIVVILSLAPIAGESGSTLGYAEVSLDVTERRKLERALEHGERLAAVGRLAASMAHEINNPLSVIRAAGSRMSHIAATLDHAELAECASDLDLAVERIASFVQHVCGFARRDRTILSDAPIRATIDMAIRLVRPRASSRGVKLEVEPGPDPRVQQDPPRLAQAVVNLIANAVDAAATGGRSVTVRSVEESDRVRIEVDDDGPGVAPEIAATLFEPFATTKPPGEGTGLGLSITRQIALDHRGTVDLVARSGGGTRALLELPRQDLKRYLVLVVDRDPAVRRALATDVGSAGFRVRSAGSLGQAREILADEDVRVVLTDVLLPDGPARDFLADIARDKPDVGRVVVTADRSQAPDTAALVFEKPWDRIRLLAAIREICLQA